MVFEVKNNATYSRLLIENQTNGAKLSYTIDRPELERPLNILGTLDVFDPNTGNKLYSITVGNNPIGITINPSTHTIFVINDGYNSISVIDGKTGTLVNSISTFRFEIGLGMVLGFCAILGTLFLKKKSAIDHKLIIGGILCVIGIFIAWSQQFFFPHLEFFSEDIYDIILSILLVLPIVYSFSFILFLIVRYQKIRRTAYDVIYEIPKKKLIAVSNYDIKSLKAIQFFVLVCFLITSLVIYVSLNLSLQSLISTIPGFNEFSNLLGIDFFKLSDTQVENLKLNNEDFIDPAAEDLVKNFGIFTYALFAAGAVWIFLLRQVWKLERKTKLDKYCGSRSLLLFLYFSFTFFIVEEVPNIEWEEENWGYYNLHLWIGGIAVFSTISCLFVYTIERLLIHRIWPGGKADLKQL